MLRLLTVTVALGLLSLIGLNEAQGFGRTNVAVANNGANGAAAVAVSSGGFFRRTNVAVVTGGGVNASAAAGHHVASVGHQGFVGVHRDFHREVGFNNHSYGFNRAVRFDPGYGFNRTYNVGLRSGFYGTSYGVGASYGVDQGLAQTYFDPAPQAQTRVIEETIPQPPVIRRTIVTEQVQQSYAAPLRYALPGCGCR